MAEQLGNRQDSPLTFRLGRELRAEITGKAKRARLTVGEWIRLTLKRARK
jgi:hypothetical protein